MLTFLASRQIFSTSWFVRGLGDKLFENLGSLRQKMKPTSRLKIFKATKVQYSEKATKYEEISLLVLLLCTKYVRTKRKISSKFCCLLRQPQFQTPKAKLSNWYYSWKWLHQTRPFPCPSDMQCGPIILLCIQTLFLCNMHKEEPS